MSDSTRTPVESNTRTARLTAQVDLGARFPVPPTRVIRKPRVAKRAFSRMSDGMTHPVTISRRYA